MTSQTPVLTAPFWRSRRAAAISGIVFGVLLLAALVMAQVALAEPDMQSLQADGHRRTLVRLSLDLVPFAGIAFLWFIGVVREQLGEVEDRLFSTVFMGSGLVFLVLMFVGASTLSGLIDMVGTKNADADLWVYGRHGTQELMSVFATRMAAVFTISVSTVGRRTSAIPRWVSLTGYLVALLLLAAPELQGAQLTFPGWVLLVSTVILFTRPRGVALGSDGRAS